MTQTDRLLNALREHQPMTGADQLRLVVALSLPAILSQLSTIAMQYIDASMVGSLGAEASASIGLVSTTIWLFGGLITACSTGFYVQVAHLIGAGHFRQGRDVLRQSFVAAILFSITLSIIGASISSSLPAWLGGAEELHHDASMYFLIFALILPFAQLNSLCGGMLRCSGNMLLPSLLNVVMCLLDVVFNALLIFPSRTISLFATELWLPGAGWGVTGAVCGTGVSFIVCSLIMLYCACLRTPLLNLRHERGNFLPTRETLQKAFHIASPIGLESVVKCAAQIASTIIVAPLGTIAIAANSFGIIVESLCYMPGYGVAEAATTLVGQSVGAQRRRLARSFSLVTVALGVATMSLMAVLMYVFSPEVMSFMTPDPHVQSLTVDILRIEAFAEPGFAASIVVYGVFVGLGKTTPSVLTNLFCMWAIRIPLAALLATRYGLTGVWIAMAIELTVRGLLFLLLMLKEMGGRKRK